MKLKLADLSHGPEWMIWAVAAILAVISIILISGHGSWIISGYNTMRMQTATFCGHQGRISRPVRAILNGQF